jgi:hypothetical protein
MAHSTIADEQYVFRTETRNKLFILLGVGIAVFILGLFLAMNDGGHGSGGHETPAHGEHGMIKSEKLVATTEAVAADQQHGAQEAQTDLATQSKGAPHHAKTWLDRLYTSLWMNNVFFTGLGIIGLFFVAIQYAASAGWSAGLVRIPLAMGTWIPIAGVLMIVLYFVTSHHIFHWTHEGLYVKGSEEFDPLINKKAPFFFWPGKPGGFPIFYIFRMVLFFGLWYWFFLMIRKNMLAEDLENSSTYWYKNRVNSTVFLIIFAVSSSVCAWDWVMSIDTHWFSTMFGWYVFASWWVTGLALIVASLKSAGYLKVVDSNHIHDLGKFVFAFSIFWTYIWFGQFLLIYYANIPEETVYFIERMTTAPYSWIFYLNLILNFVLPFLLLMTRDAKRQLSTIKLVCPIVIVGHWFDFFNMVTPGVMQEQGGVGFLEIGVALIFIAAYLLVVLGNLAKVPLIGKNHPMLQESLHHHI